eukprot:TRINITY_DN17025_c0_g1_i1.p1 TRINITY_DN17025_c0_g1~~TRINITY_DN17025_c0_g1_i1.p1  ORF type:complete len:418 (+),score=150.34 TRINITY_DN17025_c0_g1_i1:46-1299(+)
MSQEEGAPRIPVRLLTGFLGCGKTTLLNEILTAQHGLGRVGVIENEYGSVGVDSRIVSAKSVTEGSPIIEVSNGCLCCAVRGDLKRALLDMAAQQPPVDSILLEASGVADPGPVVQTLLGDSDVASRCSLAGVVTVVDAKQFLSQLESPHHPQIRAQVAFADLIILNKTDLVYPTEALNAEKRLKEMNPVAAVHPAVSCKIPLKDVLGAKWFDNGKALQGQASGEEAHAAALNAVQTVSVKLPGAVMNLAAVELWLSHLVQEKGETLFRYKGLMPIRGYEQQQYLFQGVHQIFGGELLEGSSWEGADAAGNPAKVRGCEMVFIGTGLDEGGLKEGLAACVAPATLRFEVGDAVSCATAAGWQDASVAALWQDGCPYLLVVDSKIPNIPGRKVMAPLDSDTYVKALPREASVPRAERQ